MGTGIAFRVQIKENGEKEAMYTGRDFGWECGQSKHDSCQFPEVHDPIQWKNGVKRYSQF